jgi:hypothetical protein
MWVGHCIYLQSCSLCPSQLFVLHDLQCPKIYNGLIIKHMHVYLFPDYVYEIFGAWYSLDFDDTGVGAEFSWTAGGSRTRNLLSDVGREWWGGSLGVGVGGRWRKFDSFRTEDDGSCAAEG